MTWYKKPQKDTVDESQFVQGPDSKVLETLQRDFWPESKGRVAPRTAAKLAADIMAISPHLSRRSGKDALGRVIAKEKQGTYHTALEVAITTHDAMSPVPEADKVGYFERRGLRTMVEAATKYYVLFPPGRKIPIHGPLGGGGGEASSNDSTPQSSQESKKKTQNSTTAADSGPSEEVEQSFTKEECLCLLSCAFLCLFPRVSDNCTNPENTLPSINYDEQLATHVIAGQNSVELAKTLMVLDYFDRMTDRWLHCGGGDDSTWSAYQNMVRAESLPQMQSDIVKTELKEIQEKKQQAAKGNDRKFNEMRDPSCGVTFLRRAVNPSALDSRDMKLHKLTQCKVHNLGESIDDQKDMIRADFANRIIGGGAIAYGCVQEEIMFSICPELVLSRLIYPPMMENEAIIAIGSEQFSQVKPKTYAFSLQHGGPFVETEADGEEDNIAGGAAVAGGGGGGEGDTTPKKKKMVLKQRGAIACIDAADFRYGGIGGQYTAQCFLREYMKSYAGFDLQNDPTEAGADGGKAARQFFYPETVATGNWGCGAFLGDPQFKILIQWLSCTAAGKTMHYFPFSEGKLLRFQGISDALIQRQQQGQGPDSTLPVVSWEQLFNDCVAGKFTPSRNQDVFSKVVSHYNLTIEGEEKPKKVDRPKGG